MVTDKDKDWGYSSKSSSASSYGKESESKSTSSPRIKEETPPVQQPAGPTVRTKIGEQVHEV